MLDDLDGFSWSRAPCAPRRVRLYFRYMKQEITIDPKIRFGKPIIRGTRITVEEVLGALAGGMDFAAIEKEYGLTRRQILTAVRYVTGWLKGEVSKEYAVPARR